MLRGIYAILPTPFCADLSIDFDGLDRICDFCIACGVHGVVTPAIASEQPMLTDAERLLVIRRVIKQIGGRVPVVVGISAPTGRVACENARMASAEGADVLMAMPPYIVKASEAQIRGYYEAIDRCAEVPVIIQNYSAFGTDLASETMIQLCSSSEHIQYIKEESAFSSQKITKLLKLAEQEACKPFRGVMGGKAGRTLVEEYRRGACGSMPACEIADVHVQVWEQCEAGDFAGAQRLLNQALPLLNFEATYGPCCYKEVLRRRGVLHAAYSRMTDISLDAYDETELDRMMDELKPLFQVNWANQFE